MKICRLPTLEEKTGLSRWTIDRLEGRGDFPKRVKLGPRSIGWLEDEVDDWIEDRLAAREDVLNKEQDYDSFEDEDDLEDDDLEYEDFDEN